jgi:hypothetical protein
MKNFFGDYSTEIDSIGETRWGELLQDFDDSNIHQTWSSGVISWGERNISHIVLRRDGEVVGMVQIGIRKLSIIGAGVATVYWGPLWRRKGISEDYDVLEKMIEVLKNEYVIKRRHLLRIWPIGFEISDERTKSLLGKYGFTRNSRVPAYRTLLLDLSPSLEELRKNLEQKWRNNLNTAEKRNLNLMEGTSDEMYLTFLKMLHEMVLRKKFKSQVSYDNYRRIQNDLPEFLKMKIIVCTCEGVPVSVGIFSAIGITGTYILGATSTRGLGVNGSNLIQWRAITWLKERGCRWYDLGGVDPSGNPGVYKFKRGVAGKNGKEVTHLGQFSLSNNIISYFMDICIDRINYARKKLRSG